MSDDEVHAPLSSYVLVFVALLSLTAVTVGVAFVDLGALNTPVALVIAVVKGLLIFAYFMHLKSQPKILWSFAIAGFFWVALMIIGTSDDYLTREPDPKPPISSKSAES